MAQLSAFAGENSIVTDNRATAVDTNPVTASGHPLSGHPLEQSSQDQEMIHN